jgi:hypothetical protein
MFFPMNAIFMFTGGFLRIPENIPWPLRAFTYVSYYRFAMDAQSQVEFKPIKDNKLRVPEDLAVFKDFVEQHR